MSRGIVLPIHAYPLFENALRAANGWTLAEHTRRIGAIWSRFSQVAATNPHAWIRRPRTAEEIAQPSPDNRMVAFPYPKLCTANMQVDQGAGYIVCSVDAARSAGAPEDRWVFPLAGADANDHWFISHRPELHRSPAIRLAGRAALELAGLGLDDVGPVDLYSCFPVAVQMAARELGLPVGRPGPAADPDRRPDLRRRTRQQLHVAWHRPGGRCAAPTGRRGDGDRPRVVCHEALGGALRRAGLRPAASPGATCRPRWTRCRSAASTPRRRARCGSRPTPWSSTARATPSGDRGLPDRRRRPGLGHRRRRRHSR